ncbi:MAG: hypothetical protein H6701_06950 [Myxococcales bacterium]|nr:hypothetical protein [Myxococcales bacterium]
MPFAWIPDPHLGPHAALAVPLRVGARTAWFQLDTGLDVSRFHDHHAAHALGARPLDPSAGSPPRAALTGRLGAVAFTDHRFTITEPPPGAEPPPPPPFPIHGSIGLDLLRGHVTTLDFPRARFCLGPAPPPDLGPIDHHPARLEHGKLFVEATLGDHTLPRVFYDSGASALTLVVDRDRWQTLTGDTITGRRVARSWHRLLTLVDGRAAAPLTVAGLRVEAPTITHVAEAPALFSGWPFPVDGQLGNVPFLDRALVLDLRAAPRFGVSRTDAAAAPAPPQKPDPD